VLLCARNLDNNLLQYAVVLRCVDDLTVVLCQLLSRKVCKSSPNSLTHRQLALQNILIDNMLIFDKCVDIARLVSVVQDMFNNVLV